MQDTIDSSFDVLLIQNAVCCYLEKWPVYLKDALFVAVHHFHVATCI